MKVDFQSKPAILAILAALGMGIIPGMAQPDKTPPTELVQYIRENKSHGFSDSKIKSQAIAVGWAAPTVDAALAYVRNEKPGSASSHPAKDPQPAKMTEQPGTAKQNPAAPAALSGRGVPDDYLIGSGDTLQIAVWKEPELSVPSVIVRSDGKITVPLAKEIDVVGLTPPQVEQKITEKLKEYVTDPVVTVVVAGNASKKVYVIGAARKEGPLPYTYGMTVLQALSEAGGLTDYAKRKEIHILHTENGQTYQLDFNYDAVVKGQNIDQNIVLLPNDTIVIPH